MSDARTIQIEIGKKKGVDPAGYVYLDLANDPTVLMFIREIQAKMDDQRIKWQSAPTLHVTLVYAPIVSDAMLNDIAAQIHMPDGVGLDFDGVDYFDGYGEEGVPMILRGIPSDGLRALQQTIFEAFKARDIDISPYSVPDAWKAHVTLAYLPPDLAPPEFPNWGAGAWSNRVVIARGDYEPFAEITATKYHRKSVRLPAESRIFKDYPSETLRLMRIVTSNAYKDREDEIITEAALTEYVESCWKDGDFIGDNPLLVWHAGDPIGDIIYAEMAGPFLVEIARERPNKMVNLARVGDAPMYVEIKQVWNGLQNETELGASHEFAFVTTDRKEGVYARIIKTETSTLPRRAAANLLTDGEILRGDYGHS